MELGGLSGGGFVVCRGLSWTVVDRRETAIGVGYPRRLYECQV